MAHLNISNDSIVNGYYLDSNMTSYDSMFVHHKSINQLFDWLEYLTTINPDRIDIVYDSTYGYPKYIFVDKNFNIADEEMGYFTELILVE